MQDVALGGRGVAPTPQRLQLAVQEAREEIGQAHGSPAARAGLDGGVIRHHGDENAQDGLVVLV